MNNEIKVSVFVISYNHKAFLKECLDSILAQKTTFEFEVLVHDDASIDGSQEMINEYSKKHSNLVAILQAENQYSKGIKPFSILKSTAKGDYIAWCEGDDFWGDEHKLQKQFDFMEANPEYSLCYHNSNVVDENSSTIRDSKVPDNHKVDYSKKLLQKGKISIPTQTSFFISSFELPPYYSNVVNEDIFIFIILGSYGKGKYLSSIMSSSYRVHDGGVWSKVDKVKTYKHLINTYKNISKYYYSSKQLYMALYFFMRKLKLQLRLLKSCH